MLKNKKNLELILAELTQKNYSVFSARASSVLFAYLTMKRSTIPKKRKFVLIPNIICLSVPYTTKLAGFIPLLIDINLDDFNVDYQKLHDLLIGIHENVAGIILPHIYGHLLNKKEIFKVKYDYPELFIIEDAAQTFPYQNEVGDIGDVVLMSFGHTKPLFFQGGGCLFLDNEEESRKVRKLLESAPVFDEKLKNLSKTYNEAYYFIRDRSYTIPSFSGFKKEFYNVFKSIYFYKSNEQYDSKQIEAKIKNRAEIARKRNEKSLLYRKYLDPNFFTHPTVLKGTIPWRYTVISKLKNEMEIAPILRKRGINVSPWYPMASDWLLLDGEQNKIDLSNSQLFADHVLNFWVDESISEEEIIENIKIINNSFQEYDANAGFQI